MRPCREAPAEELGLGEIFVPGVIENPRLRRRALPVAATSLAHASAIHQATRSSVRRGSRWTGQSVRQGNRRRTPCARSPPRPGLPPPISRFQPRRVWGNGQQSRETPPVRSMVRAYCWRWRHIGRAQIQGSDHIGSALETCRAQRRRLDRKRNSRFTKRDLSERVGAHAGCAWLLQCFSSRKGNREKDRDGKRNRDKREHKQRQPKALRARKGRSSGRRRNRGG